MTMAGRMRSMTRTVVARSTRRSISIVALACATILAACAHKAPALPGPDTPGTPPPDLSSLTVMILPAQAPPRGSTARAGLAEPVPGLDSEINFFLTQQAPRVRWVSTEAVKKAAASTRAIGVHPEALSVSQFSSARITRIGDPLWGDLRLLGTLMDARYALLPFAAGFAPDSTGTTGRVEIGVAIIDTGNGNVLWTGYVAGERGAQDAPAVVASAARALAKKISP
jgi:hypothetical protein